MQRKRLKEITMHATQSTKQVNKKKKTITAVTMQSNDSNDF